MNFEPVHIHKTHKGSYESMIFLLIPILIFVTIMLFMVAKTGKGSVAGSATELTYPLKK
ncbi:MAG: hypothetical protein AAB535_01600 [Patescibacteria group bacterium]